MKLNKQDKKVLLGLTTLILKNNTELLKLKITEKKNFDSMLLMTYVGAGEVISTTTTTLVQAALNKDTAFINSIYKVLTKLLDKYISMCKRNKDFILEEDYIDELIVSLIYLKEKE